MAQLLAKIEEGNRETHRRMELVQSSIGSMESTMKGVIAEQGEIQKWKPEVEAKMNLIAGALKDIQGQVEYLGKRSLINQPAVEEQGGLGERCCRRFHLLRFRQPKAPYIQRDIPIRSLGRTWKDSACSRHSEVRITETPRHLAIGDRC